DSAVVVVRRTSVLPPGFAWAFAREIAGETS
ncbi:unnamed protein product, partial [marine sediment metagenome]